MLGIVTNSVRLVALLLKIIGEDIFKTVAESPIIVYNTDLSGLMLALKPTTSGPFSMVVFSRWDDSL